MRWQVMVPLLIAPFLACSAPRIDTTSDEAMKESVAKVRERLPEPRRPAFDQAMQTLAFNQINLSQIFSTGQAPDPNAAAADFKTLVNGLTGEEVIAAADRVIAAQKAKERERALQEIAELVKERDQARAAAAELAKFEVLRSRFYKGREVFGTRQPVIELRVRNGTQHPVSRAYFKGRITSPGRAVPWLEEDFNYPIAGGIEPGEEASWKLAPNMFSAWGTVHAPPDAGLEVTVTELDGADGESVLSVREFTSEDQARLEALQREYGGE